MRTMGQLSAVDVGRDQHFRLARRQFFEEGECPDEGVPALILSSWQRCRALGVDRANRDPREHGERARLAEVRERSARLVEHASGVMEHVFEQIRASGSVVLLSDPQGMIVHSLGDADFVDRANRVALQPGACWSWWRRSTVAKPYRAWPSSRKTWWTSRKTSAPSFGRRSAVVTGTLTS